MPHNATRLHEWLRAYSSHGHGSVKWQADPEWFSKQAESGCCPAAELIYSNRPGYRCCKHKLDALLPLRPVGGLSWDDAATYLPSGALIVLNGDSMVEQQLVAMMCAAWATPGFRITTMEHIEMVGKPGVDVDPVEKVGMRGATVAEVRCGSWRITLVFTCLIQAAFSGTGQMAYAPSLQRAIAAAASMPTADGLTGTPRHPRLYGHGGGSPRTRLTLRGNKWKGEELLDRLRAHGGGLSGMDLLGNASALLIGGWHHALPKPTQLRAMLKHVRSIAPSLPTLLVEALPPHFPGGRYHGSAREATGKEGELARMQLAALPVCPRSSELKKHPPPCRYAPAVPPDLVCDQWAQQAGSSNDDEWAALHRECKRAQEPRDPRAAKSAAQSGAAC